MTITEIIKYEGDNDTLVWKHPSEDFNTKSQLIVHESQEAVFYLNGQALDLFAFPGRYTLETNNIPFLRKVLNIATGGETPFHCEVYFINKTEKMNMNWGTDSKINYADPTNNGYVFPIGAFGTLSFSISDSRKLLVKLVGTTSSLSNREFLDSLKGPIQAYVKAYLPQLFKKHAVPVFDLDEYLLEFSEELRELLNQEFEDYGVHLDKFWINAFNKPEDDPTYKKIIEIRGLQLTGKTEAQIIKDIELVEYSKETEKTRMDIEVQAYKQRMLGFTYQQERGFDVAEKMAENEGTGSDMRNGMMNMGMGIGAMGAVANVSGRIMGEVFNPTMMTPPGQQTVNSEPVQEESGISCDLPGMVHLKKEETKSQKANFEERVKQLKMMYENGLFTEEEFQEQRQRLLDEIF